MGQFINCITLKGEHGVDGGGGGGGGGGGAEEGGGGGVTIYISVWDNA